MRHLTKKLVAVILAATLLLSLFPVSAFAAGGESAETALFKIGSLQSVHDVFKLPQTDSEGNLVYDGETGEQVYKGEWVTDIYGEQVYQDIEYTADRTCVDVTGSAEYTLGQAIEQAAAQGKDAIVLSTGGTISQGYTIPAGVTLLIPFDEDNTVYTTSPQIASKVRYNSSSKAYEYGQYYETPSAYRTLTMLDGASITVADGASLSVSGKMAGTGTTSKSYNGTPTGPDGRISMQTGSSIVLEDSANLYAWGYIYGSGTVTADSGSSVYEMFQIRDWPGGGDAFSAVASGAFPINQYYVQNIEVPITMEAGATETIVSAINAFGEIAPASVEFIGPDGMFQLQNGYIIKDYDEANDRLNVEVYGDSKLSAISLRLDTSLMGASIRNFIEGVMNPPVISTADYTLPLTNNISVDVKEGTTEIIQSMELLPGGQLQIEEGAALVIDKEINGKPINVIIDDAEDWTGTVRTAAYTAAAGGAPTVSDGNGGSSPRTNANNSDAEVDINGTLEVYGGFYTTRTDGGNVHSSEGTGSLAYASDSNFINNDLVASGNAASLSCSRVSLNNGNNYQTIRDDSGVYTLNNTGENLDFAAVAQFSWNGTVYDDLDSALAAAQTEYAASLEPQTVVLAVDGPIFGEHTIPKGVTLLIPFDSENTVYTTDAEVVSTYTEPTAFRTMTMIGGAKLTVNDGAAISLGGQMSSKGQNGTSRNGTPTGPDGRIAMETGSSIVLESGANLYAWGFIYGSGEVTAQSGSAVYEMFQILDWPGGSDAFGAVGRGAFPVNQYYVQNIEVPMTVYAGASETVMSAINAYGQVAPAAVEFIGKDGMFQLQNGYLVKDYIEAEDRLDIQVYGDSKLSAIVLKLDTSKMGPAIAGFIETALPDKEISTSQFTLPLTNNISVDVKEGTTEIIQSLELLPGGELTIDDGAKLVIDDDIDVYIYDADDWVGTLRPVHYSAANGTDVIRTSADKDADVDINGSVEVYGSFYATSQDGANVHSSEGTGEIKYATDANSTDVHPGSGGTASTLNCSVVTLKNEDGTVNRKLDDGIGDYDFQNNYKPMYWVKWLTNDGSKVIWQKAYYTDETPVYEGDDPTPPASTDAVTYSPCIGWATAENSDTVAYPYENPSFPKVGTADVSYYAIHTASENTYTITFYSDDAETVVWKTLSNVPYSDLSGFTDGTQTYLTDEPSNPIYYSGNFAEGYLPAAVADDVNVKDRAVARTNQFTKWMMTSLDPENHNCTMQAIYRDSIRYLVVGLNEDGSLAWTKHVYAGEAPDLSDTPVPAKNSDQYDYTSYWLNLGTEDSSVPVVAVPSSADGKKNIYQAAYDLTERSYTVIWKDEDGTELLKKENVLYSAIDKNECADPSKAPEYSGSFPSTSLAYNAVDEFGNDFTGRAVQTAYSFDDWVVNYDVNTLTCTLTAAYTATDTYLVVWLSDDMQTALYSGYYNEGVPVASTLHDVPLKEPTDSIYSYKNGRWRNDRITGTDPETVVAKSTADTLNYNCFYADYDEALMFRHSLTLDSGKIGLNFYVNLGDHTPDEFTADITWDNGSMLNLTGEQKTEGVKFTVPVAAKEIFDVINIKVRLKNNAEKEWSTDYSVAEYAQTVINDASAGSDLKDLCHALLAYGNRAREYFGYESTHTFAYTDTAYTVPSITEDMSDYRYVLTSTETQAFLDSKLRYYGCALTLGSEAAYTLYFRRVDGVWPDEPSAVYADDHSEAVVTKRFMIDHVYTCYDLKYPAAKLFDDVELTINGITVTVNAKSYLALSLADANTSAEETNVLAALYNYSQSAKTYFTNHPTA